MLMDVCAEMRTDTSRHVCEDVYAHVYRNACALSEDAGASTPARHEHLTALGPPYVCVCACVRACMHVGVRAHVLVPLRLCACVSVCLRVSACVYVRGSAGMC